MIIDAAMFFNELDMLEMRMNELDSVVDHFVIVEAEETIGSSAKHTPVLRDNWSVVKSFEHKVKYVLLPKLIPPFVDSAAGWQRELYQRNQLFTAALELNPSKDSVLITSDVDEIPRAAVVTETIPKLTRGIHRFNLDFFYYNVNRCLGGWPWGTTIGTIAQYEAVGGTQNARSMNYHDDKRVVDDAGWHFSYFGGIPAIREKVEHFSHASDDFCKAFLVRDDKEAAKDIAAGQDIYRTRGMGQFGWRDSNDPRLPAYFLNNREKFKHWTEEHFKQINAGLL
jgi:beta-1,4-mannosyl-glycoprotein beta-1,4-N-acetylglucosaminyltransferase